MKWLHEYHHNYSFWWLLSLCTVTLTLTSAQPTPLGSLPNSTEPSVVIQSASLTLSKVLGTKLDIEPPQVPKRDVHAVRKTPIEHSNVSGNPLHVSHPSPSTPNVSSQPNITVALRPQSPEAPPPVPSSGPYVRSKELHSAVIVEDRPAKALLTIISHMLHRLPNTTLFHVFHSPANVQMIRTRFKRLLQIGKMRLTNLASLNVTHVTRYSSNWLYLSEDFWNMMEGENILIFQMDSCLCSGSTHKLEEYLGKYDFIGGPYANTQRSKHQNGGFSLRVKSKMIEAIRKLRARWDKHFINEDIFFSVWGSEAGIITTAPLPVAQSFCIDSWFYPSPFAVHKITARLHQFEKTHKPMGTLLRNCPEIQMMIKLQSQVQKLKSKA